MRLSFSRCLFLSLLLVGCAKQQKSGQTGTFKFSDTHGDFMVLQREPAMAAVYGNLPGPSSELNLTVSVTVTDDESGSSYSVDAVIDPESITFKALLHPNPAGGSYTIVARCQREPVTLSGEKDVDVKNDNTASVDYGCCFDDCSKSTATLSYVTFGDVWYCGGQSNMALPLEYTFSRNISFAAILRGQYDNIRIHGLATNMNSMQAWSTPKQALKSGSLLGYGSTCWYFGESLTDELAIGEGKDGRLPIGLLHTAEGGTMIEDWLDNETVYSCHDACIVKRAQPKSFYERRVMAYVDMSIKGWVWYQGENNMAQNCILGNSIRQSGYACLLPKLVKTWRAKWSTVPGTTDPLAPFGIVALPQSGGLGHGENIGTMRWAQTGGYGVLPNSAMPNTFLVQSYDLDDPYKSFFNDCWRGGCCYPKDVDYKLVAYSEENLECTESREGRWKVSCDDCLEWCSDFCANLTSTHALMGLFHPRLKKGIGLRLAKGAVATAYRTYEKAYTMVAPTGPSLAGCKLISGENSSGATLTLLFNQTLMGNDAVVVQEYDTSNGPSLSKLEVLVDPSKFCMQINRGRCIDDGDGNEFEFTGNLNDAWVSVDITAGLRPAEVVANLSDILINNTVYAVRYMWYGDCCNGGPEMFDPNTDHCPLSSCPIMSRLSSLPANPFIAKIFDSKCHCIPPMDCSADPSEIMPSGNPTMETQKNKNDAKEHVVTKNKHRDANNYSAVSYIGQIGMICLLFASLYFSWRIRPSNQLVFGFSEQVTDTQT